MRLRAADQLFTSTTCSKPPKIIVVNYPAVLIPVDGDVKLSKVQGYNLEEAQNTPFFLVKETATGVYYMKGGPFWYRGTMDGATPKFDLTQSAPQEVVAYYRSIASEHRFIVTGTYGPLREGEIDKARQSVHREMATRYNIPGFRRGKAPLAVVQRFVGTSFFDQELLDLYDDYAHGRIHRRGFLEGAAKFAVGGLTAEALLATLSPAATTLLLPLRDYSFLTFSAAGPLGPFVISKLTRWPSASVLNPSAWMAL